MQSRNIRPSHATGTRNPGGFPPSSRRGQDESQQPRTNRRIPDSYAPSRQEPSTSAGRSRGAVDSTSSESSTASSLLDRMKARSTNTSTRTSLEDNDQNSGKKTSAKTGSARYSEDDEDLPPDPNSAGNSLWSRIVTAAGSLTINVGKAWEGGHESGEETPVGQESRVTRALKAYHLQRAKSPADLPAWLFEVHERGLGVAARSARSGRTHEKERENLGQREHSTSRGFKDNYTRAPTTELTPSHSKTGAPSRDGGVGDSEGGTTRAASRLKAIRDAKRTAATGGRGRAGSDPRDYEEPTYIEPIPVAPARRPPPRVGLPSGPGRARRL